MRARAKLAKAAVLILGGILVLGISAHPAAASDSFISQFHTLRQVASTVPANGDLNPYGTVVVRRSEGRLVRGDVLVSNFNDAANAQGTGSTIVQISPQGQVSLFAQIDGSKLPGPCPGGVGLTTALSVLPGGWVVVGSLPTTDGTAATIKAGCLIVLDKQGMPVETLTGPNLGGVPLIDGPWDMTSVAHDDVATLFVTNVASAAAASGGAVTDKATVVRLRLRLDEGSPPKLTSAQVIANRLPERTDPAALVIGPTGLGLGRDGTLFVADTLGNRIAAIPDALTRNEPVSKGITVSAGGALAGPLGLAIAPNGHIVVVNGNDGNMVELTDNGQQVAVRTVEPMGAGTLFGLAIAPHHGGVYFVDDGTNALDQLGP